MAASVAEIGVQLFVTVDGADRAAFHRDLERHLLKYGAPDEYAPHLKREAEADMERMLQAFLGCIAFETRPAGEAP